jgi:hypothetical protein
VVTPERLIARLSLAVSVVEVQLVKLVDEASVALDNDGLVPAPTILVTGNPAPSADLKISTVTEPFGVPARSHP